MSNSSNNVKGIAGNKNIKLVPLTIRVEPDVYKALNDISDKNSKSIAEIVRLVVDVRIVNYLKSVNYISDENASNILFRLNRWVAVMKRYRSTLRDYGINYNQILKSKNVSRKFDTGFERVSDKDKTTCVGDIEIIESDKILSYIEEVCFHVERLGPILMKYMK